jgi:hypothetical protein
MSTSEKEIISLIIAQDENDQVDFKKEYYSKEKKYDLIKDIVSFANNTKPRDKYIVFGIENSSRIPTGISLSSLPDISEINNLLHMYVDPFIDVELGHIEYKDATIGFIRIPHNELNRPYVISKEYSKNKVTSLRKGEIYIRKGASNFICERTDLDDIYNNRGTLDINFHTPEITISNIQIINNTLLAGKVRFVLQNNTPKTIVINSINVYIHCGSNLIEHKIDFVDDNKSVFNKTPNSISNVPVRLSSGDCIQKTAFFMISEPAALNLNKKDVASIKSSIKVFDVLNHVYQNAFSTVQLIFTDDLPKKWGC